MMGNSRLIQAQGGRASIMLDENPVYLVRR
jgi:hypothetical protein